MSNSKSRWMVIVWVGLVASTSAVASSSLNESAPKSASTDERLELISVADSVSYVGGTTNSTQSSEGTSKLQNRGGFDSNARPGPSSLPFILAGMGALAVAATRRRSR